jgi:hypothetical protein
VPLDLDALIALVERRCGPDDPLGQIDAAEAVALDLSRLGDRLIGYYVEQARVAGRSWSHIGSHLGISRQAAQQRYAPRWSSLTLADLARAGRLSRFTARTRGRLEAAANQARAAGRPVSAEDILRAVLEDSQTMAARALVEAGVSGPQLRGELRRRSAAAVATHIGEAVADPGGAPDEAADAGPGGGDVALGRSARRCLDAALGEAIGLGHNYIGTEHLLLGALHVIDDFVVTLDDARAGVKDAMNSYLRGRE